MKKKFLSEYISTDSAKSAQVFLSEVDETPVYEVTAQANDFEIVTRFLSEEEAENYAEDFVVVVDKTQ